MESRGLPNTASRSRIDSDTAPSIILSPIICLYRHSLQLFIFEGGSTAVPYISSRS